jgi:hypothetical protein
VDDGRLRRVLLAFAWLMLASVVPALAQRSLIVTSQDHSLTVVDDCDHFHTQTVTSFPAQAHAQEQREMPITGELLRVRASEEGGISIRGWDRPVARLTVCKYAVGLSQAQAQQALGKIGVSFRNGELVANGPEIDGSHVWWVHMILRVPKRANLDLASDNGGIAIRNMNGRVSARAKNGGISLASCGGEHRLSTENGGISLEKVSGKVDASTENGPISLADASGSVALRSGTGDISIRLADAWKGVGLDARSDKGGLKLRVRDNYPTSIEARTEDSGEILCSLRGCAESGGWEPNRKLLRLGDRHGVASIRLSTSRAPIVIEQAR